MAVFSSQAGSLLKNVIKECRARQKQARRRSLHGVNEHFRAPTVYEPVFNAALHRSA